MEIRLRRALVFQVTQRSMCTCALACVHYLMCLMHETQCVSSEPSYQHDISHLCHGPSLSLIPQLAHFSQLSFICISLNQSVGIVLFSGSFCIHLSLREIISSLFVNHSVEWNGMKSDIGQKRKEGRRDGTEGFDRWCGVTNGRRDQKIIWTEDKASNLKAINNNQ